MKTPSKMIVTLSDDQAGVFGIVETEYTEDARILRVMRPDGDMAGPQLSKALMELLAHVVEDYRIAKHVMINPNAVAS